MSWKRWTAVAALIGGGILMQIPGPQEMGTSHQAVGQDGVVGSLPAAEGAYKVVSLDVTGMT